MKEVRPHADDEDLLCSRNVRREIERNVRNEETNTRVLKRQEDEDASSNILSGLERDLYVESSLRAKFPGFLFHSPPDVFFKQGSE